MKKKIMFILSGFEPSPSPNGVCVKKIMDEYVKQGYEVFCLDYIRNSNKKYELVDNIHIFRVSREIIPNFINMKTDNKFIIISQKIIHRLLLLYRFILLPFWPLLSPINTIRVTKKLISLHKIHNFDMVISIYKPMATLFSGYFLKLIDKKVKFIPYYLDSLSGGYPLKIKKADWTINKGLKWENKINRIADSIILMESSKEHHLKYNKDTEWYKRVKFLDIPLLTVEKLNDRKLTKEIGSKVVNIYFIGSLTSERNPEFFLKIFEYMDNNIHLTFIGPRAQKHDDLIAKYKSKLSNRFSVINSVPHSKISVFFEEADVFLNFGVKIPSAISAKIFEYISYSKPIVSTYSIDDEACIKYLTKYPSAFLIDERDVDYIKIAKKLEIFIRNNSRLNINENSIGKIFINNTTENYVNLVNEIFDFEGENL